MFAFCFVLVVLINLGVNGQNTPLRSDRTNTAALFGQLHHLLANQQKISCYRVRPNIKNPHPVDNTKYVVCRDEQRYDVFTCPNGGIFNNTQKACLDLCQQNNPCLNQGQCIILPDLTLQCVCRRDWTGEQCEIPLSSCAHNPCGPDGECRMLNAGDYSQDYVCICNKQKSYGRNCLQTVPNPCLLQAQQYHPFAYSRRAYINCDDEMIFFQPCNANLYWNQEYKRCDRELPLLLQAPFANLKWRNQQTNNGTSRVFRLTGFSSNNQVETTTLPSRVFHLSGFSSNNLPETTTPSSRVFHLSGFSSKNNNNQYQASGNFQPWQEHNKRTWTPDQSVGSTNGNNNQNLGQWDSSSFETTTVPSQVFHLSGFSSKNNDNQYQASGNFQQWQEHNKRTWTPDQSVGSTNGNNNQNFGQWSSSSFETTTVPTTNVPQGFTVRFLPGWQSNQQKN